MASRTQTRRGTPKTRATRKTKAATRRIRKTVKTVGLREENAITRAIRSTQKFSKLGSMASAYMPGSEKPRYMKTKSGYKLIKPRVTLKGGFTRGQVRLSRKTGSIGIGPLRKNKLGQFGYHTTSAENMRHKSLDKAVKKYGGLSVYRSLNAIAVYNKNTHPETATVARSDRDFVKAKYFEN